MNRVYVVAEGLTEEFFVANVLAPALWPNHLYLRPILLGKKGGNPTYARLKKDVVAQLKQDTSAYCSTMLDLHGLGEDFPGRPFPLNLSSAEKALRVERAVKEDIVQAVPNLRADVRFLPYLQLHEFEGLLFSDPAAFARGIYAPQLAGPFDEIRRRFDTPEDINDGPETAPSKRVIQLHPAYRKPLYGTLAALEVGIATMRRECPHFREWVTRLEAIGHGEVS